MRRSARSVIGSRSINERSRGALLTFAYCLGLGIPFIASALGLRWTLGTISWARTHQRALSWAGGGMLLTVGILLITGIWGDLVIEMRSWFRVTTTPV